MSTIGNAQKNFGPAANRPRVKIAYTAAIGDTSANASASAERKLKPRLNVEGASARGARVSGVDLTSASPRRVVAATFYLFRARNRTRAIV